MAFKVSVINRNKNKDSGLFSGLASLLLLVILAACSPPDNGSQCIDADEWGQTLDRTIMVNPKNRYTDAGISVASGKSLEVKVDGFVDLCPTSTVLNKDTPNSSDSKPIKASIAGWQDSGIVVTKGDKFNITILENTVYTAIDNAVQSGGSGLYAYITPDTLTAQSDANKEFFWPNTPAFFELWDTRTGLGGFIGTAPVSGKLYFRYARSPEKRAVSNDGNGDSRYSPWRGKYRWVKDKCDACRHLTIRAGCQATGPLMAACIGGWEGGCAADNLTEYVPSDQISKDPKCQEYGYPTDPNGPYWDKDKKDHWVDEYAANNIYNIGDGYTIIVSHGCQGKYGKFLQMDVGPNVNQNLQDYTPEDCTGNISCSPCPSDYMISPNVPGKCVSINDGSVYQVPEITLNPPGSVIDLNSSGTRANGDTFVPANPPFTAPGIYKSTAPASGKVWLEIVDSTNQSNNAHPGGGYYADNIGQYKVNIKTPRIIAYSEIFNILIRPLKKIIYGHCLSGFDPNHPNAHPNVENLSEPDCTSQTETVGVLNTDPSIQDEFVRSPSGSGYTTVTQNRKWSIGITQLMYNVLVSSPIFINTLRAALTLLVVVYGMLFMMGLIPQPQAHFIGRVIRTSIIIQLLNPSSWQFFNTYLFTFFIDGMNQLISVVAGDFLGVASTPGSNHIATVSNPFAFADITLDRFLSPETWLKILALLFSSPIGFIYVAIIIFGGMYFFIEALLKGAILYILCMLAIAFLLMMAPLFIAFLLFDFTRGYFTNWIKSLMSYLFQPVLMFAALSIFNLFVYSFLYVLLYFRVCWQNIFTITIPMGSLPAITFPTFSFMLPDGQNPLASFAGAGNHGLAVGFFTVLMFVIIAHLLWTMVDFMAKLASFLTASNMGLSLAPTAGGLAGKAMDSLKGAPATLAGYGKNASSFAKDMAKAARSGGAKGVAGALASKAAGSAAGAAEKFARGATGMQDKKK